MDDTADNILSSMPHSSDTTSVPELSTDTSTVLSTSDESDDSLEMENNEGALSRWVP